ncbi:MAG TPA: GTPase [Chloroflexia bacterium]|nr:GTPase [Chloroflexia bacterium]
MRPQPPNTAAPRMPANLDDIRTLLKLLNWTAMQQDIQREAEMRLAIVGPVNSGKSTLFNLISGKMLSPASPIPGTTRTVIEQGIGPFTLIDTPGFGEAGGQDRAATALQGAATANALVVVFDAAAGLRQSDLQLMEALKQLGKPMVVVANKIDLLGKDAEPVAADIQRQLGVPVVAISAKKGTNVGEQLLPALVDVLPDLAVLLGRHLPAFRRTAANKVVRNSMIINGGIGAEPIPFIDLPLLLANQARMVLRIAAIYGEPFTAYHARELISTIAGGVALRYLAQEVAKLVPVGGSVVAGGIAAAGTWAMGQVAIQYFESGKRLSRKELRTAYEQILKHQPPRLDAEPDASPARPEAAPLPPEPGPVPVPADGARRPRFPFGGHRPDAG